MWIWQSALWTQFSFDSNALQAALAIEMGADAIDIGKTIHPHPTLGESIGMAAEVAHGSRTDLPPVRK